MSIALLPRLTIVIVVPCLFSSSRDKEGALDRKISRLN